MLPEAMCGGGYYVGLFNMSRCPDVLWQHGLIRRVGESEYDLVQSSAR